MSPEWIISEEELEGGISLEERMQEEPVEIIASLDDAATRQAVEYALGRAEAPFRIYGEGRSIRNLYYLDYGVISALVVPDEYYMGYRCVETMAGYFDIYRSDVKRQEIRYLTVTPETLHAEENVGILFPAVR